VTRRFRRTGRALVDAGKVEEPVRRIDLPVSGHLLVEGERLLEIVLGLSVLRGLRMRQTSYAGKLVTGLGKGGGVSVTVRADHTSI